MKSNLDAKYAVELIQEECSEPFQDSLGIPRICITDSGGRRIIEINSDEMRDLISLRFYKKTGNLISKTSINNALQLLSARARFSEAEPVEMHTRIAENGGSIFIDLSDGTGRAVEITPIHWGIAEKPPVYFNHFPHQKAQAIPVKGGDIRQILEFLPPINHALLFLCALISYFIPGIPKPILIWHGEKGSGKTTANGILKSITDPSEVETVALPDGARSMTVALYEHYFLPFDNISKISDATSDTLCRVVTGDGIIQRKLHTNNKSVIFKFMRCISLNGIENIATRPDLLDRSILIELERILENKRRPYTDMQSEFVKSRPEILGAIFSTLSKAMQIYPSVDLKNYPRMADFAKWGFAIGEALGGYGAEFLEEYEENLQEINQAALDNDLVATLIIDFMETRKEWIGTPSELYGKLMSLAKAKSMNTSGFPKSAAWLARRLYSMKSNLIQSGITLNDGQPNPQRTCRGGKIKLNA